MCANLEAERADLKTVDAAPSSQDDVAAERRGACADEAATKTAEAVPTKKRKTRRGKTKRRNYPYVKNYR